MTGIFVTGEGIKLDRELTDDERAVVEDIDRTAADGEIEKLRARIAAKPPPPPPRPTVWFQSRGADVAFLQEALEALRFYVAAEGDEDGDFAHATDAAVRLFQGAQSLPQDGIVNAAVWDALTRAYAKRGKK